MTVAPKPLLTIEGLRVEFDSPDGRVVAVRDAGLSIRPGEIVGLIGESGSGKTLTCRSVDQFFLQVVRAQAPVGRPALPLLR